MIDGIFSLLNTEFEKNLFASALRNLEDIDNKLRLNNFAYAMRELTRHVLYRLAPDNNVLQCKWYSNETQNENGITRKQRAIYAVQGGLDDLYVQKELAIEVNAIHTELIRSINALSKFTHIEPNCFDLANSDVNDFSDQTISAVSNFLHLIKNCHQTILEKYYETIDTSIVYEVISDTIQSIDELCSHHYIEEIYTSNVIITTIDHSFVNFKATGTISCELQYGSNSDLRNDIGAIIPISFPFSCELFSAIDEPSEISVLDDTLVVDTSSWSN